MFFDIKKKVGYWIKYELILSIFLSFVYANFILFRGLLINKMKFWANPFY